jgi:hypothetical protein
MKLRDFNNLLNKGLMGRCQNQAFRVGVIHLQRRMVELAGRAIDAKLRSLKP